MASRWFLGTLVTVLVALTACRSDATEDTMPQRTPPTAVQPTIRPTGTPLPLTLKVANGGDCGAGMVGMCIRANWPVFDGSYARLLTAEQCDSPASISQDGTRVLFIRRYERAAFSQPGINQCEAYEKGTPGIVHVMNVDGTGLRNLGVEATVAWLSPDGAKVAYGQFVPGRGRNPFDCYVFDLASDQSSFVGQCTRDIGPWSPDSRSVIFATEGSRSHVEVQRIVSIDGQTLEMAASRGWLVIGWTDDGALLIREYREIVREEPGGFGITPCRGQVFLASEDAVPIQPASPTLASEYLAHLDPQITFPWQRRQPAPADDQPPCRA